MFVTRDKMYKRIISNKAKCKKCGEIIESKHVHDFVECKCGNLFVDGGHQYLRRGYVYENSWEELSEVKDGDDK